MEPFDALSAFHVFIGLGVAAVGVVWFVCALSLYATMPHGLSKGTHEEYHHKVKTWFHVAWGGLALSGAYLAWSVLKVMGGEELEEGEVEMAGPGMLKNGLVLLHLVTGIVFLALGALSTLGIAGYFMPTREKAAMAHGRKHSGKLLHISYGCAGIIALYVVYSMIHLFANMSGHNYPPIPGYGAGSFLSNASMASNLAYQVGVAP